MSRSLSISFLITNQCVELYLTSTENQLFTLSWPSQFSRQRTDCIRERLAEFRYRNNFSTLYSSVLLFFYSSVLLLFRNGFFPSNIVFVSLFEKKRYYSVYSAYFLYLPFIFIHTRPLRLTAVSLHHICCLLFTLFILFYLRFSSLFLCFLSSLFSIFSSAFAVLSWLLPRLQKTGELLDTSSYPFSTRLVASL